MADLHTILSSTHIVQAIIVGGVLAYLSAVVIMDKRIKDIQITANGWTTSLLCGRPENGMLTRAAVAKFLPLVNVAEEAIYWTTTRDSSQKPLSGKHDYLLHFPAGQLPPHNAFWSLTITDTQGYMKRNPVERYSLGSRGRLDKNLDGSIDLFIQRAPPALHEPNWLPAPAGTYKLTLRVYLPGQAALDGQYQVPPVTKVR